MFTGYAAASSQGIHIIPFIKQDAASLHAGFITHTTSYTDQWINKIVEERPGDPLYPEDTVDLDSINDIRNGMLVAPSIHQWLSMPSMGVLVVRLIIITLSMGYELDI